MFKTIPSSYFSLPLLLTFIGCGNNYSDSKNETNQQEIEAATDGLVVTIVNKLNKSDTDKNAPHLNAKVCGFNHTPDEKNQVHDNHDKKRHHCFSLKGAIKYQSTERFLVPKSELSKMLEFSKDNVSIYLKDNLQSTLFSYPCWGQNIKIDDINKKYDIVVEVIERQNVSSYSCNIRVN